jgi:predicted aspartyl protease
MSDMLRWLAAAVCGAWLLLGVATAQVYHWVDDQGTIHYTTGIESVPEQYRDRAREFAEEAGPGDDPESPSAAATAPTNVTSIAFTPGSPIVVSAQINGMGPLTLILDTGADRTVVSPRALARIGVSPVRSGRAEVKGVTGVGEADLVPVHSVEVGGARSGPLTIVVHDADLNQVDGLLGRDFLDRFHVAIDSRAGVVTLAPQ